MPSCASVVINPSGQANIEVTGVTLPQNVVSGAPFDIKVDYTNTGDSGGSFILHTNVGSATYDSTEINLNAGVSRSLTFSANAPTSLGTLHVCSVATGITGGIGGTASPCQDTQVIAAPTCDDADTLCKLEYWVINNPGDAFLIALLAAAGITTAYYMTRKGKGGKLPGSSPGKSQQEYAAQFA